MQKTKKALIFGKDSFAEIVHFYLTHDTEYEVAAFTVTSDHLNQENLFNLPIVPFETIEQIYSPQEYEMFIAIGYHNLNKTREHFYREAKAKGYCLLSYLSSRATIWSEEIGDNCFILEDNTIQPFVKIGNNVILWSGNHIGHHSTIEDHCYITSHAVISGHSQIKHHTFIGVNATLRDGITIEKENVIGAGAIIMKSTRPEEVFVPERTAPYSKKSHQLAKI